jgi:hypothetical protein
MINQISRILNTPSSHLIEDMLGVIAIFVVLLAGLTLPGLI